MTSDSLHPSISPSLPVSPSLPLSVSPSLPLSVSPSLPRPLVAACSSRYSGRNTNRGVLMVEWLERWRVTIGVGLTTAVVGAASAMLLVRPEPPPIRVIQPTSVPTPSEVVVHVSGAVAAPGVYRLPSTARVLDGLEAAGGPTTDGNPQALNLAARVRDGQQIVVPDRTQRTPTAERGPDAESRSDAQLRSAASAEQSKIDLNHASEAQLDTLPGIGTVIARRILDYRQRVGPFERVEQLLDAKLVNRSTYEQVKDLVTVE